MNWQRLLKKLKEHGYKGKDNDLASVTAYIEEHFDGEVKYDGKAVNLDEIHGKAFPPKPKLEIDGKEAELEELREQLAVRDQENELLSGKNRNGNQENKVHRADVQSVKNLLSEDPKGGFPTFGHFLMETIKCPTNGGADSGRLMPNEGSRMHKWMTAYGQKAYLNAQDDYKAGLISKATLSIYSNETSGVEGGVAVPPEFRTGIMNRIEAPETIASKCDKATLSGNSISANIDTTTPWQTSGGILPYWIGETTAITQSKLSLQQRDFRLRKLCVLCPITEELAQDASFLGGYITKKAGDKMAFALDKAILTGDGVTQPTGVIGHSGTVSVAKETNQTATSIKANNIQKAWMSCEPSVRSKSFWLVNPDCQVQLQRMFVQGLKDSATSVAAGSLMWLPANGLAGQPNETLMGRPIMYHQACATLGTVGDIVLFCPDQYLVCTKAGGVQTDSSIHLWFDQAVNALRFLYRVEGQPWWPTTVAALNGSQTYGAFVTVATRA